MTKEQFIKQIESMQEFNRVIDVLYDNLNIDLVESSLFSIPARMFDDFIEIVCTDEGSDLVFWWMYEDVDKALYETLKDESENKISLETIDELYDFMNANNMFLV